MSVPNYTRLLQEYPETGLVPDHIQELKNYLRASTVLQAVMDVTRIVPTLQEPEGMPQPAITLLQNGGFGRRTYIPFGHHFIDLFCFGASGYHAKKLLRIVQTILFPPDGPVGFTQGRCVFVNFVWGAERPRTWPENLGGWESYHCTLQTEVRLIPVEEE